jgi:hypothetical protein
MTSEAPGSVVLDGCPPHSYGRPRPEEERRTRNPINVELPHGNADNGNRVGSFTVDTTR